MNEIQNTPELRFEGFAEPWEQKELGKLVDVCNGKDYKHLDKGDIPVYGTGGYMTSVSEALSYSEDAIGIGRKGTIDKPYILRAPFWTVDTLFYAIPKHEVDLDFALCLFSNINWRSKDESSGVPSLSKQTIDTTQAKIPEFAEQHIIGAFSHNLDSFIALHQRKYERLQHLKQAMLQKMFPKPGELVPELRFEGFTEPWKRQKLGDISDIRTGSSDVQDAVEGGRYPFFIRSDEVIRSNKYVFDCEAILTPGEGRIGEVFHYCNGKFDCHQRVYKISDFKNVEAKFVLYDLQHSFKKHAMRNTVKATVDSLRLPTLMGFELVSPKSVEEQRQIASLFWHLDGLIALHQRKCERLRRLKQALLRKMFV